MLRTVSFLVALAAFGATIAAPTVARAGPGQGKRDEIRERIRAMRIARLIQVLDLDERGASRLTPVIDRAYDQIAAVTKDSGEARRDLRRLVVVQPPDDATINRLIDRLLSDKQKIEAIEHGMIVDLRHVLAPSQVARLVVALPEINRQIQQQIKRAAAGPGVPSEDGNDPGF